MQWDDPHLIDPNKPFSFIDGSTVFKDLAKEYTQHDRGLFILGPSGSGKTHYIKNQTEADWIDGDILWYATNALPAGKWWELSITEINRVEARCDVITMEAKRLGFWIMGASNRWLKPDAIIIPDWADHQRYIKDRTAKNYDGGLRPKDITQVQTHRKVIMQWQKQGVPLFTSAAEAVSFLQNN